MAISAATTLLLLVHIALAVSNVDVDKETGQLGLDLTKRLWRVLEEIDGNHDNGDGIDESMDLAPAIPRSLSEQPELDIEGIPQKQPTGDSPREPRIQTVRSRSMSYKTLRKVSNAFEVSSDIVSSYKRASSDWPTAHAVNLDALGSSHPAPAMREGQATDTDTCHKVRAVPASLRNSTVFYKGIHEFYRKYTETYGIPIVGSANVTDEGLMRACYVVKMLLASRYDVRNAVYKFHSKIGLIGDGEQQTSMPEYSTWDPVKWNSRVRGLGPTLAIPMSSAGDDNQRCRGGERYWDQDILVHEFSHHVDQIGATYTIPGFKKRLYEIYTDVVKVQQKWGSEYAASNMAEYFATASQFYFNAFQHPGNYKSRYNITDRASLRAYDPAITALLDEVHPCVAHEDNRLIHRCDWNACNSSVFELVFNDSLKAKSECPELKSSNSIASLDACADMACYYKANMFNWIDSRCRVLKCRGTKTFEEMQLAQGKGTYNIYRVRKDLEPKMDLSAEFSQTYKSHCLKGPSSKAMCSVNRKSRVKCGWKGVSKNKCKALGCCFAKRKCFYPKQVCVDSHQLCPERAKMGHCQSNPGFMYRKCPRACDICDRQGELDTSELEDMCQDKNIFCPDWAKARECTNNPAWMNSNCQISCNVCSVDSDPLGE